MHFYHEVSKTISKHAKPKISYSHSPNQFMELCSLGFSNSHFLVMFQEEVPLPGNIILELCFNSHNIFILVPLGHYNRK